MLNHFDRITLIHFSRIKYAIVSSSKLQAYFIYILDILIIQFDKLLYIYKYLYFIFSLFQHLNRSWCSEQTESQISRMASLVGRQYSWIRCLQRRCSVPVYWFRTSARYRPSSICISVVQTTWQAHLRRKTPN